MLRAQSDHIRQIVIIPPDFSLRDIVRCKGRKTNSLEVTHKLSSNLLCRCQGYHVANHSSKKQSRGWAFSLVQNSKLIFSPKSSFISVQNHPVLKLCTRIEEKVNSGRYAHKETNIRGIKQGSIITSRPSRTIWGAQMKGEWTHWCNRSNVFPFPSTRLLYLYRL